jgi:hypothetical protein
VSLVFMDSFDHYATADLTTKWPLTVGSVVIQPGGGRRGTQSLRCPANVQTAARLFTPAPTWVVGMSVRFANAHPEYSPLLDWADGTTVQAQVRVTGTGQIQLCRNINPNAVVLATSTVAMGFDTTYYLEWLLTIHASTGVSTVRLDGVPVVSVSNANTQVTGTAQANRLRLGSPEAVRYLTNLDLDDLYVCTNQTAFLGDCRVDYLAPAGDGTYQAWTPSTGTTHYTLVDEAAPNGDTDYLSSITPGERESHHFPALPSMPNPLIRGVQHCLHARKDDAGTRQVRSLLKSGATTQVGSTLHTLALSYVSYQELYEMDPQTGVAWTVPGVNALEAGVETQ